MKLRRKFRLVFFLATIVVMAGLVVFLAGPLMARMRMTEILRDTGFEQAHVGKASRMTGGYQFTDIRLDNNNFSTIERITLQTVSPGGTTLAISKLVLTGELHNQMTPDIAGWTKPANLQAVLKSLYKNEIDTVRLDSGQFDVAMPLLGLIRLEAKGSISTILPDNAARLQATLWSVQQKMKGQINITGEIANNGMASLDAEITEGKVSLSSLTASRMGGWVILNRDTSGMPWTISAQIMAGNASLYGLPLSNLTVSTQGTTQDATVTVQAGGSSETARSPLAVDAQLRRAGEDRLSLTLRAEQFGAGPGGVLVYDSRALRAMDMLKTGNINLTDLAGNIWMKGILKPGGDGKTVDVDVQSVALQPLIDTLGLHELKVDGTMTGLLPLVKNSQDRIIIDQGLLRSAGTGTITLESPLPGSIETTRPDTDKLLKSFLYEKIELSLSGDAAETLTGDIALTGKSRTERNPKTTLITLHFQALLFGNAAATR